MSKEYARAYFNFNDEWRSIVLRHPVLTAGQKLVLIALIQHRHSEKGTAWLTAKTLAEESGQSLSVARKALRIGEQEGLLVTLVHGTGGQGMENRSSVRGFTFPRTNGAEKGVPTDHDEGEGCPYGQGRVSPQTTKGVPTGYLTHDLTHERTHDNNCSPTGVGGDPDEQADLTDFDYFLAHIEPVKRASFTRYCDRLGVEYQWALDEFTVACDMSLSRNWIKKFLGFTRDWAESHAA